MSLHGQKAPVVGCRPAVFGHLQGPRFHIRPCGPLRTKSPWPLSASADAENTSPESGLAPARVAGCVSHINLGTILKMPTILVHSGCCNKNTVSWVAFNKHLFLTDLEAGSPRSGCLCGQVLVKALFLVADCQLLTVSSHGGRGREQLLWGEGTWVCVCCFLSTHSGWGKVRCLCPKVGVGRSDRHAVQTIARR